MRIAAANLTLKPVDRYSLIPVWDASDMLTAGGVTMRPSSVRKVCQRRHRPLRSLIGATSRRRARNPDSSSNSALTAGTRRWPCGSRRSLAHPPKRMRQASAEYGCKPHAHGHHGQHRRTRETVMLESRRRIDEHHAVDGECRGGDRGHKRDDACND